MISSKGMYECFLKEYLVSSHECKGFKNCQCALKPVICLPEQVDNLKILVSNTYFLFLKIDVVICNVTMQQK